MGDIWVKYGAKPLPGSDGGQTPTASPTPTPVPATAAATPAPPAKDPWASVGAPALPGAAPAPDTTPGPDPLSPKWKPSGNAFLDFMSRPRAKNESIIPAMADTGLSLADAATFGYLPKLIGAQKAVEQANKNLGWMAPVVQGLGYTVGPGKILGPLAKAGVGAIAPAVTEAAAPLATRIAGSAASGAAEGTVAGGAGAAGHDQNIEQGALWGGGTGGLFGGLFGGSGPARKAPEVGAPGDGVTPPTGMYAEKGQAYSPLDSIYFGRGQGVRSVNTAAQNIKNVRDPFNQGANVGIAPEAKTIVNDMLSYPTLTGSNVQKASAALRDLGDPNSHRIADQLDQLLKTGRPTMGGGPGDAWSAKTAGDAWHQKIQDLNRLDAEGPQGQPAPTKSAIQQTKQWYDKDSPQGQALNNLQEAQKPGFNWNHARHIVLPLAFEGAAQADRMLDPNDNAPWIRPLLHSAAAASAFSALPALAAPRYGAALNDARFAIGTGTAPSTVSNRVGDVLMRLQLGQAAANQSPY